MSVDNELLEIRDKLARCVERVSIRGAGLASFVYAQNRCRTVEISEHNGGFWLELWEPSDDDAADSFRETTVGTAEIAIEEAIRWLTN